MSCCSNQKSILVHPTEEELREAVRHHYAKIVQSVDCETGSRCEDSGSCFLPNCSKDYATQLGYTAEDLDAIPRGSNLGQGCGNPLINAQLKAGDVVLDLGSGAGFDAFLAARAVGETGQVIGVDMTPEMITRSRQNANKKGYTNVQFRLGELEYLPVADSTVDVIISNCVINLVPNKAQAFREAYRVLKSGGHMAISDLVTSIELPDSVKKDLALYAGCIAGASVVSHLETILKDANFVDIKISPKSESKQFIKNWAPNSKLEDFVSSALIEARKP